MTKYNKKINKILMMSEKNIKVFVKKFWKDYIKNIKNMNDIKSRRNFFKPYFEKLFIIFKLRNLNFDLDLPKKEIYYYIRKNPHMILYYNKPSLKLQKYVISFDPENIINIKNPNIDIQKLSLYIKLRIIMNSEYLIVDDYQTIEYDIKKPKYRYLMKYID